MKDERKPKEKFIITEIAFSVTIAIILLKCSSDIEGFKAILYMCVVAFIGGTILNVVFYIIETRIIHRTKK